MKDTEIAMVLITLGLFTIAVPLFLIAVYTTLQNFPPVDSGATQTLSSGNTKCPEGERCIVEVLKIHRYGEYYIYSLRTNYNEVVTGILFGQTVLLNEPIEILYTKEDVMLGQAICIKYKNGFVASGDRRFCGW